MYSALLFVIMIELRTIVGQALAHRRLAETFRPIFISHIDSCVEALEALAGDTADPGAIRSLLDQLGEKLTWGKHTYYSHSV